jgi:hypothetical protein
MRIAKNTGMKHLPGKDFFTVSPAEVSLSHYLILPYPERI